MVLDGHGRQLPAAPRFHFPPGAALLWFWMNEENTWIVQTDAHRLLAIEFLSDRPPGHRASLKVLDLAQGSTRSLELDGMLPLPPWTVTAAEGAPLFSDGARLLRIDVATGKLHVLGPARRYEPRGPL
jgi:hypothetical protein